MKLFRDLKVGDTLPTMQYEIDPAWVERDTRAKGDNNPWYLESSPFGGSIAPPTINNADFDRFLRANQYSMSGVIPMQTSHEYFGPLMVGSTVTTTCTVAERWERKGREYVTFQFETSDAAGNLLMRKRDTLLQVTQIAEGVS